MLVYAHRGSSARLPENTLAAFQGALDDGADGVEFDLHATADGVPVVIHDRELERTTNGTGHVDAISLPDLQALDADGERVPTFAEVLDLLGGRLRLDIEIKQAGIEREMLDLLARHPGTTWAVSSFGWDVLRVMRRLAPEAELWPLAEHAGPELIAVAREIGAPAVALYHEAYDRASADQLAAAGLNVVVWTVNDPAEARRVRDLGAVGCCTDDPAGIRTALG